MMRDNVARGLVGAIEAGGTETAERSTRLVEIRSKVAEQIEAAYNLSNDLEHLANRVCGCPQTGEARGPVPEPVADGILAEIEAGQTKLSGILTGIDHTIGRLREQL